MAITYDTVDTFDTFVSAPMCYCKTLFFSPHLNFPISVCR